jgi:hypothetical protein
MHLFTAALCQFVESRGGTGFYRILILPAIAAAAISEYTPFLQYFTSIELYNNFLKYFST